MQSLKNALRFLTLFSVCSVVTSCNDPNLTHARRVIFLDDVESDEGMTHHTADSRMYLYGIHATLGWHEKPVVLRFEHRVPDEIKNGTINAAHSWNDAVGFELLVFGDPIDNFRGPLMDRTKDSISTIGIERHWCRTEKSESVIGTTIWNNLKSNIDMIESSDIVFNTQHYTITDAMNAESTAHGSDIIDAETLALHELGHLLGLAHVDYGDEPDSIMKPIIMSGPGSASRVLSINDVARARFIYVPGSSLPEGVSRSPPPSGPRPPSSIPPRPQTRPCDWTSD